MPSTPATLTTIASAVSRLLAERGPLTVDELLAALADAGVDLGVAPADTLLDLLEGDRVPAAAPLPGDRWVLLTWLLAGRVFCHRLTAAEVAHDVLDLIPDLEPLADLAELEAYDHLVDGAPVQVVVPGFDEVPGRDLAAAGMEVGWLLPVGRLAALGLAAGDLVGLRARPGGWELVGVAPGAVDEMAARRAVEGLRALVDDEEADLPCLLADTVWALCADDPRLFASPMPPMGDLVAAAGLHRDVDLLAPAWFDFAGWRGEQRLAGLRREYGLGTADAAAVLAMVTTYGQVADLLEAAVAAAEAGDDPRDAPEDAQAAGAADDVPAGGPDWPMLTVALPRLADPVVAMAVLDQSMGRGRVGAAALGLFAESLEELAPRPRPVRAALRWLRARAVERMGNVLEAERGLLEAESIDPSWPLVLVDLARYAGDRGDATRGLELLRRAGAPPDDELVQLLTQYRAQPRPGLGRNQPCWCGSGRKYKVCHLRREQLPLEERAAWLYQKAGMFVSEGAWEEELWQAARARAAYDDAPDVAEALGDPLVADAVLFEGGAFAAFLAERGVLLPDDERLLAEQWLLVDRSVFEIESTEPGVGLTVRDLRTGDRVEVRERTASRTLSAGLQFCARVVPAGDTWQIFGGVEPVGLADRDALLALLDGEPDAVELVGFLSRRFAPPRLTNTEGEPLVWCTARLRVPDTAALTATLDRAFVRDDGEPAQPGWREDLTTGGLPRLRAWLRLDGDELVVQANSQARQDRVLATLRASLPDLVLLEDRREPMSELVEAAGRAPDAARPADDDAGGLALPGDSAELAAVLAEVVAAYERAWLDEAIPALAGLTPREAAADPTRRPDLVRLLDSFPQDEGEPGRMSPRRLRAALGLPT